MKQLTDNDIEQMVAHEYAPDNRAMTRAVRAELKLGQLVPTPIVVPQHATLDFHNKTEEQAWQSLVALVKSGTRTANVITGASGILKIKFQQWVRDSVISPYIISADPINNGSFFVRIRHKK